MNRLRQLIREVHHRSLWQVLAIYAVASWAVLQVVDTAGGALQLPDWLEPVALVLLIVGLPIVLATAFVQEGRPRREAAGNSVAAEAPAAASRLFTWRNALGGGVLVFAVWGVVAAGWVLYGGRTGGAYSAPESTTVERSVAVLPFVNMSGDPDNEYFSDGITEELLNVLAQLPELRVPGRTSSFAFKDQNLTIRQIADTLDVANILEGSVRRSGDRVLITAQLVDARADAHLWSDTFERELSDIFSIQREIAQAIADQLQVSLLGDQRAALLAAATASAEAHDAYLKGRYLLEQRTPESLENAIQEFTRATELDPEYAEAFAGLADTYVLQASFGWIPDLHDFRDRVGLGLAASERATELDADLGAAFTSRGFGLWNLGEWEAARRAFEQGIRLNPQYALMRQWHALLLFTTGRQEEGVIEAQRAVELDPLYRQGYQNLGWALQAAGRVEDAVEVSQRLVELEPDWWVGWGNRARLLLNNGYPEEGLEAGLEQARLMGYDIGAAEEAYRAIVRYSRTGQRPTAPAPADWISDDALLFYLTVGQPEPALDLLEANIESGRIGVMALYHSGGYDSSLRDNPRYQTLLREAGIRW